MKILVTGIGGQLGYDIMKELGKRHIEAVGTSRKDLDITDRDAVEKKIKEEAPDAVIHCAAWTAVDNAEDAENREKVIAVNRTATENIARACKEQDIKMMYFSTDYVFSGDGERPWKPDDPTSPLNFYGLTKCEGEEKVREHLPKKHFILRIQWVYGINGKNFVKTMLKLAETHDSLTVVDDQTGSPSYTKDLAKAAADIILTEKYGTYHAANEGYCTWYEFAKEIFKTAGKNISVSPVTSDKYPAKAKRPHNSRMDTSKLSENGFELLPSWQDALHRYIQELSETKIQDEKG